MLEEFTCFKVSGRLSNNLGSRYRQLLNIYSYLANKSLNSDLHGHATRKQTDFRLLLAKYEYIFRSCLNINILNIWFGCVRLDIPYIRFAAEYCVLSE